MTRFDAIRASLRQYNGNAPPAPRLFRFPEDVAWLVATVDALAAALRGCPHCRAKDQRTTTPGTRDALARLEAPDG